MVCELYGAMSLKGESVALKSMNGLQRLDEILIQHLGHEVVMEVTTDFFETYTIKGVVWIIHGHSLGMYHNNEFTPLWKSFEDFRHGQNVDIVMNVGDLHSNCAAGTLLKAAVEVVYEDSPSAAVQEYHFRSKFTGNFCPDDVLPISVLVHPPFNVVLGCRTVISSIYTWQGSLINDVRWERQSLTTSHVGGVRNIVDFSSQSPRFVQALDAFTTRFKGENDKAYILVGSPCSHTPTTK